MKESFIKFMDGVMKGMQEPIKNDIENIDNSELKTLCKNFVDINEKMQELFNNLDNEEFSKDDKHLFTVVASIFTQNLNRCIHDQMQRDLRRSNNE